MSSQLDEAVNQTIKSAARKLKGVDRRGFQAEAARDYCKGSPRIAERTFGWNRKTVQKGLDELETGEIFPMPRRQVARFFSNGYQALKRTFVRSSIRIRKRIRRLKQDFVTRA